MDYEDKFWALKMSFTAGLSSGLIVLLLQRFLILTEKTETTLEKLIFVSLAFPLIVIALVLAIYILDKIFIKKEPN